LSKLPKAYGIPALFMYPYPQLIHYSNQLISCNAILPGF